MNWKERLKGNFEAFKFLLELLFGNPFERDETVGYD
jgi:hypothetical protein